MNMSSNLSAQILDTALKLAENQSWETIRLYEIAQEMGISLNDVRAHYAEKEDLIDAWFDRADQWMLQQAATPEIRALGPHERLEAVMMSWMEALAAHRKTTREMILGRLEPGHVHIQWAGLMRVSRTVQWMREAARRNASHVNRALEETLLTSIYLLTFGRWLTDNSEHSEQTRRQLRSLLGNAQPLLRFTEGARDDAGPQPASHEVERGNTGRDH